MISKSPLRLDDLMCQRTVEVKPTSEDEQELLRLTATVPFDDRQCRHADVDDLRLPLTRSYLKEVGSDLYRMVSKAPPVDLGRRMNIVELPVHPQMRGTGQARHEAHHEAHDEAHEELSATEVSVLRFVADRSRNRREIAEHLGLKSRSGHFYKVIDSLRNIGLIELTIPDKPQSKNQRMRITRQGRAWLGSQNQERGGATESKGATGDMTSP